MPTDTLDLAGRLLDQNIQQHTERMAEAVSLRTSLAGRLDKIENDLAEKPGKLEVRSVIAISSLMFGLMLISFLQRGGVDTASTVQQTRVLLSPGSDIPASTAPAVEPPAPAAADGAHE